MTASHVKLAKYMRQPLSYNVNVTMMLLCITNDSLNILLCKMKLRISVKESLPYFRVALDVLRCVYLSQWQCSNVHKFLIK